MSICDFREAVAYRAIATDDAIFADRFNRPRAELLAIQVRIKTVIQEQFIMATAFDYLALFDDENLVGGV